jgi:hypothetical protein
MSLTVDEQNEVNDLLSLIPRPPIGRARFRAQNPSAGKNRLSEAAKAFIQDESHEDDTLLNELVANRPISPPLFPRNQRGIAGFRAIEQSGLPYTGGSGVGDEEEQKLVDDGPGGERLSRTAIVNYVKTLGPKLDPDAHQERKDMSMEHLAIIDGWSEYVFPRPRFHVSSSNSDEDADWSIATFVPNPVESLLMSFGTSNPPSLHTDRSDDEEDELKDDILWQPTPPEAESEVPLSVLIAEARMGTYYITFKLSYSYRRSS